MLSSAAYPSFKHKATGQTVEFATAQFQRSKYYILKSNQTSVRQRKALTIRCKKISTPVLGGTAALGLVRIPASSFCFASPKIAMLQVLQNHHPLLWTIWQVSLSDMLPSSSSQACLFIQQELRSEIGLVLDSFKTRKPHIDPTNETGVGGPSPTTHEAPALLEDN